MFTSRFSCIDLMSWNWTVFRRNFRGLRKHRTFGDYQVIESPGSVSPTKLIPHHIRSPPYGKDILPPAGPQVPELKECLEINFMRESCALARDVLNYSKTVAKVGITTDEIDSLVHDYILARGAYPSPLHYRNYPKSICTSINNVICHGIPDNRPLCDGDIINIDITVYLNGFHGDCSETFLIGNVDEQGQHLVEVTKQCLYEGIKMCGPGEPFHKIGTAIEALARNNGLNIVPAFIGHGIGRYFHGPPDIYHFRNRMPGVMLPGMTFTIEPAISQGSGKHILFNDGWTAVTVDGSRAAQFEHTVLITEDGVEILTAQN